MVTLVDAPRVEHKALRPFTPEEAQKFLGAVKGDRLEALYSVALSLGLRQGEALGLRREDVDLENGTLSARCALQRVKGKLELVEPKTQKSRRTIAFPAMAVSALTKHKMVQESERQWAAGSLCQHGFSPCSPGPGRSGALRCPQGGAFSPHLTPSIPTSQLRTYADVIFPSVRKIQGG